jgi:hypothetical protein
MYQRSGACQRVTANAIGTTSASKRLRRASAAVSSAMRIARPMYAITAHRAGTRTARNPGMAPKRNS